LSACNARSLFLGSFYFVSEYKENFYFLQLKQLQLIKLKLFEKEGKVAKIFV
jgi:hypothetical protein